MHFGYNQLVVDYEPNTDERTTQICMDAHCVQQLQGGKGDKVIETAAYMPIQRYLNQTHLYETHEDPDNFH